MYVYNFLISERFMKCIIECIIVSQLFRLYFYKDGSIPKWLSEGMKTSIG